MAELDQKQVQESMEGGLDDSDDVSESLSELLDSLTDREQDILLSQLSEREIKHLSVLDTTGDQLTQNFTKRFRQLKVSQGRQGRSELIEVADAISKMFEKQEGGRMDAVKSRLGL